MAGQETNGAEIYQKATADAGTIKSSLADNGSAETYTKLQDITKDVLNNNWAEEQKTMYMTVLSQTLMRNKVLPELAINFIDKEAPRDANGEIRKDPLNVKDKKNLSTAFSDTLTNKPGDILKNAFYRSAINNFDKLADAVSDGDTGRLSKADLKKLLDSQPKRRP